MIKFAATLFGIFVTIVVVPVLVWQDYQAGDWLMLSVDVTIAWLWGDWLWRTFKQANKDS